MTHKHKGGLRPPFQLELWSCEREKGLLTRPAVLAATAVVAHGDVHEDVAVVGIEAHDQRFLVFAAFFAEFIQVNDRRVDFEAAQSLAEPPADDLLALDEALDQFVISARSRNVSTLAN